MDLGLFEIKEGFPSPTGVKYYEYYIDELLKVMSNKHSFRPQQGLSIMNKSKKKHRKISDRKRFRPQQGLSIMNEWVDGIYYSQDDMFPSPTGVKYYES